MFAKVRTSHLQHKEDSMLATVKGVPGITIATDIICGYPTETTEDFEVTMSLCRQYCFPSLFINQFFPRPGTPAARLPRIDPKLVKRRTKELSDFFQSYHEKLDAELWLLNSCTVKSPAEHHLRNEINAAHELGKKVVVAGCVSQGAPKSEFLAGLSIVGVQQIDRVVEVVEETLKGNSVRLLGTKKKDGKKMGGACLQLPKIRRNPLIEIISINTGCLNQCTYCKTKHARGQLGSYPIGRLPLSYT
ncbi:Methylthiotransferase N-terminal [Trinorchestia longiramus]|nr:Methylthiotransferase N-terminal [Trinorchestia longiramus]